MLRDQGWTVAIVEKWNPHVHIRQDLWGFADLLAFREDTVMLVQTTTGNNVGKRLDKIQGNTAAALWLRSSSRVINVHGWRKLGDYGKRKLWECRVIPVTKCNDSVEALVSQCLLEGRKVVP